MTLLHRLGSILRWILRRDRAEAGLTDELQTYLDMSAADKMREGRPRADAYRLARMEIGGLEQVKERVRTERHGHLVDEIGRDVRYALRMFAGHPGFTAVILTTLALSIGVNTTIYGLIDALMMRTLPVPHANELVLVNLRDRTTANAGGENLSYAIVRALADRREVFAGVGGFTGSDFNVGPARSVSRVQGGLVTGDFYSTLGLSPAAGRLLTGDDDRPGAELVVVISDAYWARNYARDASAVSQHILINGKPARIVGVTPREFSGVSVGSQADVTLAVAVVPQLWPAMQELIGPGNFWLRALARPAPGVSSEAAAMRLNTLWPTLADSVIAPHWPAARRSAMAASIFVFEPGATGWTYLREIYTEPLFVLMAVAGLVLVIACANIASLLLARASTRQREMAVRLAIGAGRGRIVRQLVIEGVLLSALGAALGIFVAWFSSRFLVSLIATGSASIVFDLTPNWHIVAFSAAIAALTGIVFGLAPALQTRRTAPSLALSLESRTSTRRSRLLPVLVAVQIALSLVLVAGGGLFVRTLMNLRHLDPGFTSDNVFVVRLQRGVGPAPEQLADAVRAVPGVTSVGIGTHTPLDGSSWSEAIMPAGQPLPEVDNARIIGVGPHFLETLQIARLKGRGFGSQDVAGAPGVAIVNARFASAHFPNQEPLGRHLASNLIGAPVDLEIVGVVADTAASGLRRTPPPIVYVPFSQFGAKQSPSLVFRAPARVAEDARTVLQAMLPASPVEARPMSVQVDATIIRERLMATLAGGFGALALLLSAIGLYGLLAYSVARQSREIGIRIALGASTGGVLRLVLGKGARLVVIGALAGYPLVWLASKSIESMLFGLKPSDPGLMATTIGILGLTAFVASYVPAWRASRIDPLEALRHE